MMNQIRHTFVFYMTTLTTTNEYRQFKQQIQRNAATRKTTQQKLQIKDRNQNDLIKMKKNREKYLTKKKIQK